MLGKEKGSDKSNPQNSAPQLRAAAGTTTQLMDVTFLRPQLMDVTFLRPKFQMWRRAFL
jgi:hypothetical protein